MNPPKTKISRSPLSPDDPMNKALRQLEEYDAGTPKRTTRDHTSCCSSDVHAEKKEECK